MCVCVFVFYTYIYINMYTIIWPIPEAYETRQHFYGQFGMKVSRLNCKLSQNNETNKSLFDAIEIEYFVLLSFIWQFISFSLFYIQFSNYQKTQNKGNFQFQIEHLIFLCVCMYVCIHCPFYLHNTNIYNKDNGYSAAQQMSSNYL